MSNSLKVFTCILKAAWLAAFSAMVAPAEAQVANLSRPEKIWAAFHPFAALKVRRIQRHCDVIYQQAKSNQRLDSFAAGGRLDAYRHVFYMAAIAQKIHTRKVRKLGIAHEKGNYRQFLKGQLEEGERPDSLSSVMDLRNNDLGIAIGCNNRVITQHDLSELVISAISEGKAWILLRDADGRYLTCERKIIDFAAYTGKWHVPKCLVASSTTYIR